ncbi:RNA polymerase sigma factor [Streptomyces sp. NPDC059837]|uniref:RNA polymerase sigma factor n=1 Tax=unclassified Streptomyces TaxID=2593676 RepID=UPI00225BE91D|nr:MULTISPECIES: RNA polymerase sigma factor [unclassified Streptomyces]MCX4408864.1 RNA polymerase sigma factor [Streptomyces sp. NBC_01764]MCX4455126.1 RNA polymerase sigma factor [Streptomyces sp. NBC_01719]MCX4494486.1 RNA polymerase sigma factor [Streptomyces sp. NBC_01728]MCX4590988.1 RNA polymerase sigma factor [Streptomyces sp. NBC_01549]MCX5185595.1 RNA polymerase sigma factor [Streptomyces sp. NBC_00268]
MRETRSDGELLRAIAADADRRAFEELYRRYAPWLTARLRGRCADAGVVDDVVQETFLAIWRGTASYREEGDAAGWLWRIGSRRLIDTLRGDGARGRLRQTLARFRHRHEASAEERVLAGVEHGDLAGALIRLSPELRAVLQATVIDGLTTREAAVLLGIPPGTVKTRALRARKQLREELA